jgi:ppGpp synthetase/RelA/SpoT-type nucleotidyltranferase
MDSESILAAYASQHDALATLQRELEGELRSLLAGLDVQLVGARLKTPESLRGKLARPDKTYRSLWDVTDLVGLRVVTFFEDTIDEVGRAIEHRFRVDYARSTDKRRFSDHGRFGYRSLHYVCAAPPDRVPHPDFRFEIQIRTALQHAWAEIEHDLGYKANDAVPAQIRRRFARVASLLEVADQEFVSIRRDLGEYQDAVRAALDQGAALPIDSVSLDGLCREDAIAAIDTEVARALGKPLVEDLFYPDYLVRMLRLAGLSTTDALRSAVAAHGDHVPRVVPAYFEFAGAAFGLRAHELASVQRGYALFFVAHLAILRSPELGLSKVARLTRLYHELDHPNDEGTAHAIASGLARALG